MFILINNCDTYTKNIVHYLGESGTEVRVKAPR